MSEKTPTPLERHIALRGDNGVLISSPNGDVIQYDDSGLILKLSDNVVRELADRMQAMTVETAAEVSKPQVRASDAGSVSLVDAEMLGDIDAWHVLVDEGWFRFQANLNSADGPRGYRMPVSGGDIVADTPGAILGILSIGGPRRATGISDTGDFPYHVVAPSDDIGAVGMVGSDKAAPVTGIETLREQTQDSLIAHSLLRRRKSAHRGLPMYFVRCEADSAASIEALSQGLAFENLMTAAKALKSAAHSMGKSARVLAVGLDYCLEDTTSSEDDYRAGVSSLMADVESGLAELGFHKPVFVSQFECGGLLSDHGSHTQAQWDLAVAPGGSDLIFSAPGYMFEQTEFGRPTKQSLRHRAEMDALAIAAFTDPTDEPDAISDVRGFYWCPTFLLAERERDKAGQPTRTIRVTASARSALEIDLEADFGAVENAGFWLENAQDIRIVDVRICPEAPLDILLECDAVPGEGLRLRYASGRVSSAAPSEGQTGFPLNRGCVRDSWHVVSVDGRKLHRWALPCDLPLN